MKKSKKVAIFSIISLAVFLIGPRYIANKVVHTFDYREANAYNWTTEPFISASCLIRPYENKGKLVRLEDTLQLDKGLFAVYSLKKSCSVEDVVGINCIALEKNTKAYVYGPSADGVFKDISIREDKRIKDLLFLKGRQVVFYVWHVGSHHRRDYSAVAISFCNGYLFESYYSMDFEWPKGTLFVIIDRCGGSYPPFDLVL